ncbi:VRR-NUC domain-containing protein [Clavibacter michiganensis]|nr:VRR-NUC domain-containing protein [Clavibacter michiganensis]
MTETELQNVIIAAAKRMGYLVYHTYDSRRSASGYPDLHLVHGAKGWSLFRELKSATGRVTTDQKKWLAALTSAGVDASVWRPIDWFNGSIDKQLRGERKPPAPRGATSTAEFTDEVLGLQLEPWQRSHLNDPRP